VAAAVRRAPPGPVAIGSENGLRGTQRAVDLMRAGTLGVDAVVAGVNISEDDPEDTSVGYGGIPNEEGVVELDSSVIDGRTGLGGAVASLRNVKNPSLVALTVLRRSDHVLLVGEGALRFARAHGFAEMNLLTDKSREIWLHWRESLSDKDDWLPESENDQKLPEHVRSFFKNHGTVHVAARDANGDLASCTSTSGLAFKIPGRVGDSPILGAGNFCDNEVGTAGATGRGEAMLLTAGAASIVAEMRHGKSPEEACLAVLRRVASGTKVRRLLDDEGKPAFQVVTYALSKSGAFGGASIWSGANFAVHDGEKNAVRSCAYLFEKKKK
jgi:N4-(beta-N-acetylglucosaminyl)-L-asparaginase